MKIMAFVDMHGSMNAFKKLQEMFEKERPDVVVCAGDLTVFEQNIEQFVERLAKLGSRTPAAIPVLMIHGNHETGEVMKKVCSRHKNVQFLDKRVIEIDGYQFVGWGGGGFSSKDSSFEKWTSGLKLDKRIVLVTHAPPYGTRLDKLGNNYCGNKSFTRFIKEHKSTVLSISGHIHENWQKTDKIGDAVLVNPGPTGALIKL